MIGLAVILATTLIIGPHVRSQVDVAELIVVTIAIVAAWARATSPYVWAPAYADFTLVILIIKDLFQAYAEYTPGPCSLWTV